MTTPQLILLLVLVLVAAVAVVLVLRRASAKRDEQRVEAAGIRGEAEGMAATMTGQDAFAQQAAERAEVARLEAEERAREAARLEAEAEQQRAAAEATRREYEAAMRRADDIDPDVKESSFAPVPAETSQDAGAAPTAADEPPVGDETADATDATDASDAEHDAGSGSGSDDLPMTRAERRQAREEAGTSPAPLTPAGPGAVAAGAAAAGAVGASTWGAHDEEASPESRRIASADDFRDEVPAGETDSGHTGDHEPTGREAAGDTAVWPATTEGTSTGMSRDQTQGAAADTAEDVSRDTESPSGEWGGPPADSAAADVVIVSDTDAYASTEPLAVDEQTPPVEATPAVEHEGAAGAATEPMLASDPTTDADTERAADEHAATGGRATDDDATDGHAPAETGAAVAEPAAGTADRVEERSEEAFDPTPTRDWAADEGELLEETHQRGERLEEERHELEAQAAAAGGMSAHGDGTASAPASADDVSGADRSDEAPAPGSDASDDSAASDDSVDQAVGRRVSEFQELRDGGFGVGSAAPLPDGAQPLDHPVQAYRDTMTFRLPGDEGYDSAEPDVWFYDAGAAERSGFRRAEG